MSRSADIDAALLAGGRPRDVAKEFGVAYCTVRYRRRKLGMPRLTRGLSSGDQCREPRSAVTESLIELMTGGGRTYREAAIELGVAKSTAHRAYTRWVLGIPRKPRPRSR